MKFVYQMSRQRFWINAVEHAVTALPLLFLVFIIVKVVPSGLLIVE